MIVFYLFIGLVLFIISILSSSINIDVNKIEIEDVQKLKNIYSLVDKKKYDKIFGYINLDIKIKIKLFTLIPIVVVRIDNISAKKDNSQSYDSGLKR